MLTRTKKSRIWKGCLVSLHCLYDFRIGLPKLSDTNSLTFSASDQSYDHYHYGFPLGVCRIWSHCCTPVYAPHFHGLYSGSKLFFFWAVLRQQTEQQPVGMISPQCVHNAHNFVGRSFLGICPSNYSNGSHWKLGLALQWSLRTSVMHLPPRHSMWIVDIHFGAEKSKHTQDIEVDTKRIQTCAYY